MTEAVKNEFSELEIIQGPDYLKSYDETANLDAWSDAAAQAKENGQQLLASAQTRIREQNALFQLAPTLAKSIKAGYDARDQRLMTEQKELQQKLLASGHALSLKDLNDYYANEENIANQTGFFDQQAQILFDEGKTELANEVRALTGRRAKMMRRVLLMETTDSYEADFIAGRDSVSIKRTDEPDLTWNNAETTEERRMIMSKWRQDQGLLNNDIYKFSDEFLEDVYYKKVRQIDTKILNESNAAAVKLEEATHIEDTQRVFAAAGKLNNGLLGQEIATFVKENSGRYYGEAGARLAARNILLGMVENGLMTSAEFKSLYLHQFDHKGTKKLENYSIFKEFSLDDPVLQAKLEAAEGKALNLKTQQIKQKSDEYSLYWTQKAQEINRPFTESELKQIQQGWDQINPGQPLPRALTDQVYRTLEDKEDLDVVADIEDKLERGVALTDEYMNITGDQALKEKYQKITASELGQGLDPRIAKADKKYVKALVKEHFNMTMGTSDTDTPEYLIMLGNAERLYATSYRNAQFHTAGEKSNWARQQVEAAMSRNNGASLKVKPSVSSAQSYALKKATALGHISENGSQVVRKGILPGTEDDFKLLEKWATNPTGSIPPIYNVLSKSINKPGYTGWHLANEQYQAVTGKTLPEPKAIQTLHGKSPMIQNLLTNYPSYNGNRRAAIIDKGNGDFNIEGALLPGLQMEPVNV